MRSRPGTLPHPAPFWLALAVSAVAMVIGHVLLHGQAYDEVLGKAFNPITFYVSDYAGKWPEGLWIKGGIISFCLALGWFFRRTLQFFARGRWEFAATSFWLGTAATMITGLILVMVFDLLPPRYEESAPPWYLSIFGVGAKPARIALSAEEWSMRWYHHLGFSLFLRAYPVAAAAFLVFEIKRRDAKAVARSLVLLAAGTAFGWWLSSGTPLPGVPQRAILFIVAIWLASALHTLEKTPLQV